MTASRPQRWRRARHLVIYWREGHLVVEHFVRRVRLVVPLVALRVLDVCTRPTAEASICRKLPEYRAGDVRRLVRQLAAAGLLERAGGSHRRGVDPWRGWAAWEPAGGFFHFTTKDVAYPPSPDAAAAAWRAAGPRSRMPAPVARRRGKRHALPEASADPGFEGILRRRRTWRNFAPAPVRREHLATILRLTWGVQAWATVPGQGRVALKTSPSGGARHAGEVYVIARRVEGLPRGIYHFEADSGALVKVRDRPPAMQTILPGQSWYRRAPVLFVMTVVFPRAQWRYAFPRAYRAVLIEAGHLCQTACLVATSLGLAPFCSMAFPDSRVEGWLGIDGIRESAIYIAGVGVPPPGGWRPWSIGGQTETKGTVDGGATHDEDLLVPSEPDARPRGRRRS